VVGQLPNFSKLRFHSRGNLFCGFSILYLEVEKLYWVDRLPNEN